MKSSQPEPEPLTPNHTKPKQGWRDPDGRLQFWENVHGLDYSSMADLPLDEASVEVVGRSDMVTERCLCRDFNHETVKDEVRGRGRQGEEKECVLVFGGVVALSFFSNTGTAHGLVHGGFRSVTIFEACFGCVL